MACFTIGEKTINHATGVIVIPATAGLLSLQRTAEFRDVDVAGLCGGTFRRSSSLLMLFVLDWGTSVMYVLT